MKGFQSRVEDRVTSCFLDMYPDQDVFDRRVSFNWEDDEGAAIGLWFDDILYTLYVREEADGELVLDVDEVTWPFDAESAYRLLLGQAHEKARALRRAVRAAAAILSHET